MGSSEGTAIERVLAQQGRQLIWLAKVTGLSVSYVSLMVTGKRPTTPEFRAAAAEALGVPEDILFPIDQAKSA